MNEPTGKTFDAVQMMRSIREQLADQISGMRLEEERRWLRSSALSDAILRQLMERAAQQGDAADVAARRS
jgi:hypothetical protein